MNISFTETSPAHLDQTKQMLNELRLQIHRGGYSCLCVGIPRFKQDVRQLLSKDLYPYIASHIGNITPEAVDQAIREAIQHAWKHRAPAVWEKYFPGSVKAPSNKLFIATLAEHLK